MNEYNWVAALGGLLTALVAVVMAVRSGKDRDTTAAREARQEQVTALQGVVDILRQEVDSLKRGREDDREECDRKLADMVLEIERLKTQVMAQTWGRDK